MNKIYLLSLIGKYGVQLVHYGPGELVVRIASWSVYEDKFRRILAYLREDEAIDMIHVDDNLVNIRFDPSFLQSEAKVNRLYHLIERFDL